MAEDREDRKVSNPSVDNDPLIQQARLVEEKRIKDAEEKRRKDKARAKKLRGLGGAVLRGPNNLGEAVEKGFSAVATGFSNQLKSDEAVRNAQRAEENARSAASAYAKNPSESNKSKFQTAKASFDKATSNYKNVTGKSWPKSGGTDVKIEAPVKTNTAATGSSATGSTTTPAVTATGKPMPLPTTGRPLDDILGSFGIATSGLTATAPVKPTAPVSTGDRETDRQFRDAYNKAMTQYQIKLDAYNAGLNVDDPNGSGGGGGGGYSGPTTSVSKSVVQYSAQQVKGLANQAFAQAIGREASADELNKFLNALNSAEKADPRTTVTRNSGSGAKTTSSSTTTGGVDEQQLAKDAARVNPEYAPYQQATTYFDAMLGALNGTVGRGI